MRGEIRIYDKGVVSDNKIEGQGVVSPAKQTDYTRISIEHITSDVLNSAIQWLQQQWKGLEARKNGSPLPIIKSLSDQQKQYEYARQELEPFKSEGKQPSLDQLKAVKAAAQRQDDHLDTQVSRSIMDALLQATEKNLADWKKNFDDYREKLGQLCEIKELIQGQ